MQKLDCRENSIFQFKKTEQNPICPFGIKRGIWYWALIILSTKKKMRFEAIWMNIKFQRSNDNKMRTKRTCETSIRIFDDWWMNGGRSVTALFRKFTDMSQIIVLKITLIPATGPHIRRSSTACAPKFVEFCIFRWLFPFFFSFLVIICYQCFSFVKPNND